MAGEDDRRTQMEVIADVVRAYYDALLERRGSEGGGPSRCVRRRPICSRPRTFAPAGMSTDADVLSIRVHLAGVREQQIRRAADLDVARAALNDALGLPLDTAQT